jgi:zinc protease
MSIRRLSAFLIIALLLAVLLPAACAQVQDWRQIQTPPLPEFHPKQPVRVELPNGMVIFLQEDHELPLIDGAARIRGGSRTEPANKVGLVDIYGDAWRTGGTKRLTGDQMDDSLEARAAKLETDGSVDSTFISWSSLKGDFEDVFKLFLELLREPEFRADKIALSKRQMDTMISRRNDEIGSIAGREAARLAYGRNNPYARIAEYATVAAVTRDDLLRWHRDHVHPNNLILGISGDFDAKAMEARLRQVFGNWPRGPQIPKPDIEFRDPKPGVYFIPKEDVNQSAIRMVALGTQRNNPDYFAIEVMNEILGGGFASRLFTNIREKRGLAYSVGGGVGASWDHPGVFRLTMGTKTGSTAEAIEALYGELVDITTNPPTAEELKRAKDSILNSFIFNFDTPEKVLRERMAYEYYGYPADFLERYRAGVEKVTAADVARVAKKYIPPKDKLAVLVVANPAELGTQLSKLGPISQLDITIPPPPGGATRPSNPAGAAASKRH